MAEANAGEGEGELESMRRRLLHVQRTLAVRDRQLTEALQGAQLLESELRDAERHDTDQRHKAAIAAREATAQRASILVEIEAGERRAERAEVERRVQQAAASAELALLGSELGATEHSLTVSEQGRARVTAAAAASFTASPSQQSSAVTSRGRLGGEEGGASTRDDGVTASDTSTGPSALET
jgi:hypothetical protein